MQTEVKMTSESRLTKELRVQDELEDESAVEEREEEEEEEIYRKAIKTVEAHETNLDLLYSGAGMYCLGMSIGWKAFRVVHARRSSSTMKVRGVTRHSLTFFPTAASQDFWTNPQKTA